MNLAAAAAKIIAEIIESVADERAGKITTEQAFARIAAAARADVASNARIDERRAAADREGDAELDRDFPRKPVIADGEPGADEGSST